MHGIRTEQEHRPGRNHAAAEFHCAHGGPSRNPCRRIEPQGFGNHHPCVREGVQVGGRAQVVPPRVAHFLLQATGNRRLLADQQPYPCQGCGHRRVPRHPERQDFVPHLRCGHRLSGGLMSHRGQPGHQVGRALPLLASRGDLLRDKGIERV
jgi:hypothetical protein